MTGLPVKLFLFRILLANRPLPASSCASAGIVPNFAYHSLLVNYLTSIISTNRTLLACWLLTVTLIGCSKARTPVEARQPKATPGSPTQPGKTNIDPCSLLTAEEIESVQGEPVIDTYSNNQTGRGFVVSQCYFQLHTSANSISLNVTQKSDGPDARDPKEYWQHSFHREDESGEADRKGKRLEEEENKSPPQRIPGLGDEAFWTGSHVGSALYVLKGDVFIRISVGGSGDLASKLEKSKTLAQLVLKRL
jgi:hypothetical protein